MSDSTLSRTIRRCVALLLTPLSLLSIMVADSQGYSNDPILGLWNDVVWLLLFGALLYLVLSLGNQIVPPTREATEVERVD